MALAVPLSRFTPRVGGGSAFFVRRHSHFMSYRTPLITAALLVSLLTGCSKHSPAATNPKVTDLGVVEFSDRTPIRHDLDGGKVCVITPTMITNGSTRQVMLATTIEQPDSTKLACPRIVAFAGSPVEIRVGDIDIHLTIGVKP